MFDETEEAGEEEPPEVKKFVIEHEYLEELISGYGTGISVYYRDIESGYEYTYNSGKLYYSASVIKAPYVLYVYELAQAGLCDLETVLVYSSRHYSSRTGVIKTLAMGSTFTIGELLKYAIRNSDNVAMKMLIEYFRLEEFVNKKAYLCGTPVYIKTLLCRISQQTKLHDSPGRYMNF